MNRLGIHLASLAPDCPPAPAAFATRKPPRRTEAAYVVYTFNPAALLTGWQPTSPQDAPAHLDRSDCKRGRRFHTLPEALAAVLEHNAAGWASYADTNRVPESWALVAFHQSGSRLLGESFPRQCTPLAYRHARIEPSPTWKPSSPLDVPAGSWCEEAPGAAHDTFAGLDDAVQAAIQSNATWGKRKGFPSWVVVLGVEESPLTELAAIYFNAGLCGTLQHTATRRAHVVDATWPLSDATRELLKGGAAL